VSPALFLHACDTIISTRREDQWYKKKIEYTPSCFVSTGCKQRDRHFVCELQHGIQNSVMQRRITSKIAQIDVSAVANQ
jgi:hypothetical protein